MTEPLSERYVSIDPKLILECATGLEDTEVIAARYGFDPDEWLRIEQRPEVAAQIEKAKLELEKAGVTFQNKAKLMADKLLDNVFQSSLAESTPVKDKVSALQAVTRLAGWGNEDRTGEAGPGFSITINLPERTLQIAKAEEAVEVKPVEKESAEVHLEFKDEKTDK